MELGVPEKVWLIKRLVDNVPNKNCNGNYAICTRIRTHVSPERYIWMAVSWIVGVWEVYRSCESLLELYMAV